ncbi:biotin transport system substrate-specific component [Sulfobacillus thermosulfidooxidans DSM 9293]|uniref:Biotin transporter n=2 Tax=Sulfobacillus thermosulfidooxidans TaxID=28034 RepID=A0A1W1WJU8_SULTA|nr:biotin transporter BioY [Sulfobacillus thermosulfidooxidans]SMC06472.1 biotin transport system substrate-specific component [Sulfobacillus thermosulfidooxidans DSM 9293]
MPHYMRFLVLASFITAITAVGAITSFTLPFLTVVPFSLQVLGVYLAGGLLPPKWAFLSMMTYLILGALGLPVFAEGGHGVAILVGPFGGYLWAFPVAAWAMSILTGSTTHKGRLIAGLAVNLIIIYLGGMIGLILTTHATVPHAFLEGVVPFMGWDALKAVIAFPIIRKARAFTIARWGEHSYRQAG